MGRGRGEGRAFHAEKGWAGSPCGWQLKGAAGEGQRLGGRGEEQDRGQQGVYTYLSVVVISRRRMFARQRQHSERRCCRCSWRQAAAPATCRQRQSCAGAGGQDDACAASRRHLHAKGVLEAGGHHLATQVDEAAAHTEGRWIQGDSSAEPAAVVMRHLTRFTPCQGPIPPPSAISRPLPPSAASPARAYLTATW